MQSADPHPREAARLAALYRYEILDTEAEAVFDELTELASSLCGAPISLISLVDSKRQWFKSKVGVDVEETERSLALCAHAIHGTGVFEVSNALQDDRFFDNPLVVGKPDIRFYAGAPLIAPGGLPLGTLCVIDTNPHQLTDHQRRALEILANQVISQLEVRLQNRKLARLNKTQSRIFSLIAHNLRSPSSGVMTLSKTLSQKANQLKPELLVKLAGEVLASSQQLHQLLEELLRWSQQQWSNYEAVFEVFSLHELIIECKTCFEEQLRFRNLELSLRLTSSIQLNSDRIMLKTVLRNVIGNAIKHSVENAAITVFSEIEKSRCIIAVENRGLNPGLIECDNLIVDHSVAETNGSFDGGHNLGLILCHDFLQSINGKIWIDKEFDKGTRIWISIPSA